MVPTRLLRWFRVLSILLLSISLCGVDICAYSILEAISIDSTDHGSQETLYVRSTLMGLKQGPEIALMLDGKHGLTPVDRQRLTRAIRQANDTYREWVQHSDRVQQYKCRVLDWYLPIASLSLLLLMLGCTALSYVMALDAPDIHFLHQGHPAFWPFAQFSLQTVTSWGTSDVLPISQPARALTVLVSLVGLIDLAGVIALGLSLIANFK